jgi:hypothetical protein
MLIESHISMCNNLHMATNLALDDKLIEEARRVRPAQEAGAPARSLWHFRL